MQTRHHTLLVLACRSGPPLRCHSVPLCLVVMNPSASCRARQLPQYCLDHYIIGAFRYDAGLGVPAPAHMFRYQHPCMEGMYRQSQR
jgi:hypothetical protein